MATLVPRSTPKARHARLLEKDVLKIFPGDVFLQFHQARIIANLRCQSKPFEQTIRFVTRGHDNLPRLFFVV
jgi:hypothetical protein